MTANAPLLSAGGSLKVIQGPQYAYGPVNVTTARTGQVQLSMQSVVGAQSVGQCALFPSNVLCISGDCSGR